jgi:hypothetical protein
MKKPKVDSRLYRRIYEQVYGPIPVDADGRSFEIHHIDGNRSNNDISNLVALSIQEHYDVHWQQGDKWGMLQNSSKNACAKRRAI